MKRLTFLAVILASVISLTHAEDASKATTPISLAVFDFELEDASPAATQGHPLVSSEWLTKTTQSARDELAKSGRYRIIEATAAAAGATPGEVLHQCDGCESGLAHKLGAQQSLLGIVGRATQTDYYITMVIRESDSGKVVDLQSANFAGGQEGWPTGARVLIRHQILNR